MHETSCQPSSPQYPPKSNHPRRFLLTALGSLGDLHPYLAVGLGLRERGHTVIIATSEIYRAKVEGESLLFKPLRPDLGALLNNEQLMRRAMHPRTGTEFIIRKLFLPAFEQTYQDLLAAATDADLIVGHGIVYAVPTVAEVLQKPWISVALQPLFFLSAYDPPSVSGAPLLERLRPAGPAFWRLFIRVGKAIVRRWGQPVNTLRRRLKLKPFRNPLLDDMISPLATQAWFSPACSNPQPDWYPNTTITGFPFYDKLQPGQELDPELARFLDAGPAPVVFTLGSAAVFDAGEFYTESLEAVRQTGCRAVLLIGSDTRNRPTTPIPETVLVTEYAPYSQLLPRAAATVHQGGIGTTAQALRSGHPMIVVPWSHDQPDNGRRIADLGVGRVIPRSKYRAARAARELRAILSKPQYSLRASEIGRQIAAEDGVSAACDGIEAALLRSDRDRSPGLARNSGHEHDNGQTERA